MAGTTPSKWRLDSGRGPNRSESRRAMGRAPMAMTSRMIPPTPVAAPWYGSIAEGWLCDSILKTAAQPSPMLTAPAFSPGPWITAGPVEGRRRRSALELLYEQCSDQSTPSMPSSTSFGGLFRCSTMALYSSRSGGGGHPQHLACPAPRREGKVSPFDHQVRPLAANLERCVADQRTRQESRLAQDLEPVADAPDQASPVGELADLLHHRREPGDRTGPQIVAVGEAAGQDHAVAAFQVGVLVPEVGQLRAEHLVDDPPAVAVGPRPGKYNDAELHRRLCSGSMSNRKSSITWLASSWRHIASTRWRASCSLDPSRFTSMYLPTRTSTTSRKPSDASPCLTVMPWGSLTTGFGVTITRAITARDLGERFGAHGGQMLGAGEQRSQRTRRCASEQRRP